MAQHGGPRPNSGRKKGSLNRKSQEIIAKAVSDGITPLEYMLSVLRDPEANKMEKMEAAKSAAPFVHARLNAVDMTAKIEKDVSALSDAELLSIAAASSANSSEETEYSGLSH
jgi:hypothetical protein